MLNLAGGALLAVILTSEGVLRSGADRPVVELADHVASYAVRTVQAAEASAGG